MRAACLPAAHIAKEIGIHPETQGKRLTVRRERARFAAQFGFTYATGTRLTCFATSTVGMPITAPDLRHRRHAPRPTCVPPHSACL